MPRKDRSSRSTPGSKSVMVILPLTSAATKMSAPAPPVICTGLLPAIRMSSPAPPSRPRVSALACIMSLPSVPDCQPAPTTRVRPIPPGSKTNCVMPLSRRDEAKSAILPSITSAESAETSASARSSVSTSVARCISRPSGRTVKTLRPSSPPPTKTKARPSRVAVASAVAPAKRVLRSSMT